MFTTHLFVKAWNFAGSIDNWQNTTFMQSLLKILSSKFTPACIIRHSFVLRFTNPLIKQSTFNSIQMPGRNFRAIGLTLCLVNVTKFLKNWSKNCIYIFQIGIEFHENHWICRSFIALYVYQIWRKSKHEKIVFAWLEIISGLVQRRKKNTKKIRWLLRTNNLWLLRTNILRGGVYVEHKIYKFRRNQLDRF